MVGAVAKWRVHACLKGAATGERVSLRWSALHFLGEARNGDFCIQFPIYTSAGGVDPQVLAFSGLPYPLLNQASECKDQHHRQNGGNGASRGPWHEVSSWEEEASAKLLSY